MRIIGMFRRLIAEIGLLLIFAVLAGAAAAGWLVMSVGSTVSADASSLPLYAASAPATPEVLSGSSCMACHAEISESHAQSPHGRTLMRLETAAQKRLLAGRTYVRPDTGVSFAYRLDGDRLLLESSASARSREVTWLFGSGRHAQTPLLTWLDAAGRTASIEHSVSLYPDGQLDMTLEMEAVTDTLGLPALGNYRSCGETANCFGCHSTWVPLEGDRIREEAVVPGVGCLRCHADAAEHAAAMERGVEFPLERLSGLSPRESVDRCGECHRRADELGGPLQPDNPTLARFASVGLVQSRCFLMQPHGPDQTGAGGAGRFDCLSCHSPHAETMSSWQTHTAVCLQCHQPPASEGSGGFDCPAAGAADNCLTCHMPKVRAGNRLQFTDHWIRRPPTDGKAGKQPR
jgi:hypothetical protein